MDYITIKNLRISCIIGCNPEERNEDQDIFVTVRLGLDCSIAGRSDELSDTLDYSTLAVKFEQIAVKGKFKLIEALAEHIADACLAEPLIQNCEITIRKPGIAAYGGAIPGAECAEITISRIKTGIDANAK